MAERGRPSLFTQELADLICKRMAAGESLRAICETDGMPTEGAVRQWALKDVEGFSTQYATAVQTRAMRWAEEVLTIADEKKGEVNRDRLRVDTRKWLLSKVLPKVYGDKIVHSGDDANPIKHDVTLRIIDERDNG